MSLINDIYEDFLLVKKDFENKYPEMTVLGLYTENDYTYLRIMLVENENVVFDLPMIAAYLFMDANQK